MKTAIIIMTITAGYLVGRWQGITETNRMLEDIHDGMPETQEEI